MEEIIEKIKETENYQIYLSNFAMGKNRTLHTLDPDDHEVALDYYLKNNERCPDRGDH